MSTTAVRPGARVPGTLDVVPAPARVRPGDREREYAGRLARRLRTAIRGEVRFDSGARALYSTDGSNYRQPPIGVVIPRDIEDVERAIALCRQHAAPVFGRGG